MPESRSRIARIPVTRYRNGSFSVGEDVVVKETLFSLFLNNQKFATLVCSPFDLKEMAVGFLCSEGILQKPSDLLNITINADVGQILVEITKESVPEGRFVKRFVTTSSSQGGPSLYFLNNAVNISPISANLEITPREIFFLCDEVEKNSPLFQETGGSHCAALCSRERIIFLYEDIGRHNAVDRVLGRCFLENITVSDKILVFSGRVASEILIKVAKIGVPLIAARSAPTELAVNLAKEIGITIVGFIRKGRLNVYSHENRVIENS